MAKLSWEYEIGAIEIEVAESVAAINRVKALSLAQSLGPSWWILSPNTHHQPT